MKNAILHSLSRRKRAVTATDSVEMTVPIMATGIAISLSADTRMDSTIVTNPTSAVAMPIAATIIHNIGMILFILSHNSRLLYGLRSGEENSLFTLFKSLLH